MNTEPQQHFKLYKPYGYLSQFVNNQTTRKNKKLLGELHPFPENTMAIGRLDYDSEGLLLLTTNGKMSEFVRSRKVEKEYYVQVDGLVSNEAIQQLGKSVAIRIEGKIYHTKPCKVNKLAETPELPERAKKIRDERHGPTSWISITITEGKFRQVRKMTASVGFPTLRLIRVRIGSIFLDNLEPGQVQAITNYNILTS